MEQKHDTKGKSWHYQARFEQKEEAKEFDLVAVRIPSNFRQPLLNSRTSIQISGRFDLDLTRFNFRKSICFFFCRFRIKLV